MGGLYSLLGSDNSQQAVTDIAGEIKKYIGYITMAILVACGLLIIVYAVYIGFRLAKAEDDNTRKQAKAQLIYAIIGIVGIAVITIIIQTVIPMLNKDRYTNTNAGGDIPGVDQVLSTISDVVSIILEIVATCAVVFAIYVGWQLMKAEDDNKRKQAKTQLLYTVIAAVAVVLINAIAVAVLNSVMTSQQDLTNAGMLRR